MPHNDFENFRRAAEAHLRKGGVEPDTVDIQAHYDSGINLHENIEGFKAQYPTSSTDANSEGMSRQQRNEMDKRANEDRMEQLRQEASRQKAEKQQMAQEQVEKYGFENKQRQEASSGPKFLNLDEQSKEQPMPSNGHSTTNGLVQKVVGAFVPSEEVRAAREKESQYKEMKKQKELETKLKTSRIKAETRAYEKAEAYYKKEELKNSAVGRLASVGEGLARAGSDYARGGSSYQGRREKVGVGRENLDSGSTVRSLLTQGTKPSDVSSRFGLGPTALTRPAYGQGAGQQMKQKGHYRTIVENGKVRRERVIDNPTQSGTPAQFDQSPPMARSPLESLMFQQPQARQMISPMQPTMSPMMQRSEPSMMTKMILAGPSQQRQMQSKPNPLFQFGQSQTKKSNQNPLFDFSQNKPNQNAVNRLMAKDTNPRVNPGTKGNAPFFKFIGGMSQPKKRR